MPVIGVSMHTPMVNACNALDLEYIEDAPKRCSAWAKDTDGNRYHVTIKRTRGYKPDVMHSVLLRAWVVNEDDTHWVGNFGCESVWAPNRSAWVTHDYLNTRIPV